MSVQQRVQYGVSGIVLLCCILLWRELESLPPPRFEPMGPAMFPKMVIGCLALLTGLDVVSLWFHRKPAEKAEADGDASTTPRSFASRIMPVVSVAFLAGYILLIELTDLPYVPLTFCFVFLESWYLGHFAKKALPLSLVGAALVTGLIWGIFGIILETFFP